MSKEERVMKRNPTFQHQKFLSVQDDFNAKLTLLAMVQGMGALDDDSLNEQDIDTFLREKGLQPREMRKIISADASSPRECAMWANRIRSKLMR